MRRRKKFPRLTESEEKIMNIFWNHDGALTSPEIRKESKKFGIDGYLFRLLNNLLEKKMIKEAGDTLSHKTPTRKFLPTCTEEEYRAYFYGRFSDKSVSQYLTGLIQTTDDSGEIIDEIKQWLDEYEKGDG